MKTYGVIYVRMIDAKNKVVD